MKKICLIVAYDENKCIGKENTLPWKQKADLKRVKELTTNQTILMGRKTFESIGKALPNRVNRVLTNSTLNVENIEIYNTIKCGLDRIETDNLFVFGGASIYRECLPFVDEMYITKIHTKIKNGDTFFPDYNIKEWELVSEQYYPSDVDNEYPYSFLHLKRK